MAYDKKTLKTNNDGETATRGPQQGFLEYAGEESFGSNPQISLRFPGMRAFVCA